jgi:hypothetical protein
VLPQRSTVGSRWISALFLNWLRSLRLLVGVIGGTIGVGFLAHCLWRALVWGWRIGDVLP